MSSRSSDSEDEGFYKPTIQITQPALQVRAEFASIQQQFDGPIDVMCEGRPTDFKVRFLASPTTYHELPPQLFLAPSLDVGEVLRPIIQQNISNKSNGIAKQKRYKSLEDKYRNSNEYQLVYSKKPYSEEEYSSYIFNLEGTPDYNPNSFTLPKQSSVSQQQIFDSRFQSGNLLYAYKKRKQQGIPQYELIMQNDTNTKGYSQWFFFSIKNKEAKKIKLKIVNFIKKRLMFLDGIRPLGLSLQQNSKNQKGWMEIGNNIEYTKSYITRQINGDLAFQVDFDHLDDLMYIALNYPYTYTQMIQYTQSLMGSMLQQDICIERKILCYSISNNAIPYLRISNKKYKTKKHIVCLGRQHPGETVGSFALQGFVNQLLTNTKILQEYTFIVIPMANPDGVIYGNFRTNLAGFDLNRQWSQPNRWLHPQIFFISKFVNSLEGIQFCIDFHGHSKKFNSFIYACIDQRITQFRLYPYIFSQQCKFFSLKDCTFSITPDKIRTARINIFNLIKKPYVFTLQISFFGHSEEKMNRRFTMQDLQYIGKKAFSSLSILLTDKAVQIKYQQLIKTKNYLFEQWSNQNQDYGSQSNPSEDELTPIQRKFKVMSEQRQMKSYKKLMKTKLKPKKKDKLMKKKKQSMQLISTTQKEEGTKQIQKGQSTKIIHIASIKNTQYNQQQMSNAYVQIGRAKRKNKSESKNQTVSQFIQSKLNVPLSSQFCPQKPNNKINLTKNQQKQLQVNSYSSNLFDTSNYIKIREQISNQLKKSEEERLQIWNYKLDANRNRFESQSRINKARAERLKRQFEQLAPVYAKPKINKQRIYVIKQNKVVRSFTRVKQTESKKQKQSTNNTMDMRKEHKLMMNLKIKGNRNSHSYNEKHEHLQEDDPYKTKILLKPLTIKQHKNCNDLKEEKRSGIFMDFLQN